MSDLLKMMIKGGKKMEDVDVNPVLGIGKTGKFAIAREKGKTGKPVLIEYKPLEERVDGDIDIPKALLVRYGEIIEGLQEAEKAVAEAQTGLGKKQAYKILLEEAMVLEGKGRLERIKNEDRFDKRKY
jgi:hypothetical protein